MKTFKLVLVTIFSIVLLTAVLPSDDSVTNEGLSGDKVSKLNTDLASLIDPQKIKMPRQG